MIRVNGKSWNGSTTNTVANVSSAADRIAGEAVAALDGKPGNVEVLIGGALVTVETPPPAFAEAPAGKPDEEKPKKEPTSKGAKAKDEAPASAEATAGKPREEPPKE